MGSESALLGEVVAWDMSGVGEVPVSEVRAALATAGITCEVPELRATTAFTRATKDLRQENVIRAKKKHAQKGSKRYVIHRIDESDDTIDYHHRARVELRDSDVSCDDYELEQEIRTGMDSALNLRTQSDITRIVQSLFEGQAELYPLVPSKGVAYIVPDAFRNFTAQMETFVRSMGGSLIRVAIPRGDEVSNRNFAESVEQGLEAMIREVAQVAEGWTDRTRETTVEKHLAKLDQVIFRAECYAEHLGAQQQRLIAEVEKQREACKARLAAMMTPDEDDEPADEPEVSETSAVDLKRARIAGWDAREEGEPESANPYDEPTLAEGWLAGYRACAESESEEDEPVEVDVIESTSRKHPQFEELAARQAAYIDGTEAKPEDFRKAAEDMLGVSIKFV